MKPKVKGINTAYLYVGMWRSIFGIHSEDNIIVYKQCINVYSFYCIEEAHWELPT